MCQLFFFKCDNCVRYLLTYLLVLTLFWLECLKLNTIWPRNQKQKRKKNIWKVWKVWSLKITLLWPWLMYFVKCDMSYFCLGVIQQLAGPNYTHIWLPTSLKWTIVNILHTTYPFINWQNMKIILTTCRPFFVHIGFEWTLGR